MKSKTLLLLLVLTGMALSLNAQSIILRYEIPIKYGWGEKEIVGYFINRVMDREALFSNMTDRTKDSIVVIETFEDYYGKTTCIMENDSVYLVKYDFYDGFVNENPYKAFNNFIRNTEDPLFGFYIYVKDGDREYREYDSKVIADMIKHQGVKLCAKRYMFENLTNVALAYEEDGYHLHMSFEHKEFNINMLSKR